MRAFLVPLFVAFVLPASAQTARVERPLNLELGVFSPEGATSGAFAAIGYAFARKGAVRLGVEARFAFNIVVSGGGGSGSFDRPESSLGTVSGTLLARYQPRGKRFFGGVGLGYGHTEVDLGRRDPSAALLSGEAGVDLNDRVYLSARYTYASARALRASFVGLGFRI